MKIGQNPELPGSAAQLTSAKQQAKAATPAAEGLVKGATAATAAGVPVTLSRAARALDPTSRAQGDFDAGRVKAVRAAIENGTFKVNPEAVADAMLANAHEVLSHARG